MKDLPVVFVATKDEYHAKIVSNIQEIKARKGKVIAIVTEGDDIIPTMADDVFIVPPANEVVAPLLSVIPLQLLSYYIGVLKGCDVDKPQQFGKVGNCGVRDFFTKIQTHHSQFSIFPMNIITKHPIDNLGYNFIDPKYLPQGENEYYLRNQQNNNGIHYRRLSGSEIEILIRNGNTSDDWAKIFVSKEFDPALVKNSKFHGLIRIGKLEPFYLEFHNLRMPVGIYNSHIISCDFGDNVCIDNAGYLSHYIIGNEVMITNVNELATTDYSKFGNGILKDGEQESGRVWIEVRNENGGRRIAPFDGMLAGDAYIWSNNPEDAELQKRFLELTQKEFNSKRGYYGTIGDRCVIKDCDILKDVMIGTDAYLKGANKLKNLTINSDAERTSQIGEGCEMVNGIVGYGCRIFYGVKAVRFIMAAHSQLKYGARLINSYLGNNSTISCCEVLNTLNFPQS